MKVSGENKKDRWFRRGANGYLFPESWQGWGIFVGYFISFVLTPAALNVLIRPKTPMEFLILLVVSMFLTTGIYIFIAGKKS